jgi:integration host factor subunit beta
LTPYRRKRRSKGLRSKRFSSRLLGSIAEALQANQRVDLRGFGSFVVKERKARQGRNPQTGVTITIAAKRAATFKVGKELAEKLIQPATENSPV